MVGSFFRGLLFTYLWGEGKCICEPCDRLTLQLYMYCLFYMLYALFHINMPTELNLHLLRFGGFNVAFPKLPAPLTNVDRY